MQPSLSIQAHVVSRAGSTSEVVQRRLELVLEAINERYDEVLAQAWELNPGARFHAQLDFTSAPGGALDASGRVVEMLCELALRLTPVRCRMVLAPQRRPIARRQTLLQEANKARLFLLADGFGAQTDPLLTGSWAGIGNLLAAWTERQAQFVRAFLRAGVVAYAPESGTFQFVPGRKRLEIAAAFQVSPSVVTECLQAAEVESFRYQVWSAAAVLAEVVGEAVGQPS